MELTAGVLEQEFEVNTRILPAMELPASCFNAKRSRYKTPLVLDFLFSQLPADAQRLMGVVAGGLEGDKETHSGCAYQYDRVAAYSALPLSEWERLPLADRLNRNRHSYIVTAHEFSHILGLPHCLRSDCLMHKNANQIEMCAACRRWTDRELRVRPGSAEDRFSLAENYFLGNDLDRAITLYREAIALAPREPLYHYCLSAALNRHKQLAEAVQSISLSVEYSKDPRNTYYICGLACLRGLSKKAEEFFDQALAIAKDPRHMRKLVGQAYREIIHDVERASRHYREYLRLGGNDPDVIGWLISRSRFNPR